MSILEIATILTVFIVFVYGLGWLLALFVEQIFDSSHAERLMRGFCCFGILLAVFLIIINYR